MYDFKLDKDGFKFHIYSHRLTKNNYLEVPVGAFIHYSL